MHERCSMKTNEKLNLTMLCDFYELTMGLESRSKKEDINISRHKH